MEIGKLKATMQLAEMRFNADKENDTLKEAFETAKANYDNAVSQEKAETEKSEALSGDEVKKTAPKTAAKPAAKPAKPAEPVRVAPLPNVPAEPGDDAGNTGDEGGTEDEEKKTEGQE